MDEAVGALEDLFRFRVTEVRYLQPDGRPVVLYRPDEPVSLPADLDSMIEVSYAINEYSEWLNIVQVDDRLLNSRPEGVILPVFRKYLLARAHVEIEDCRGRLACGLVGKFRHWPYPIS